MGADKITTAKVSAKLPKKPGRLKRVLILLGCVLFVVAAIFAYRAYSRPDFEYDKSASQPQLKQLAQMYSQAKTCQEVIAYVDNQLVGQKNQSVIYDLLAEKASCQQRDGGAEAYDTYQKAYKIGQVSNPVVGLLLAQHYMSQDNHKAAKPIYLKLRAYYEDNKQVSQSIRDFQLEHINRQLKKIEVE